VPRLVRALAEDRSVQVRVTAARALGALGTGAAVPALIAASEKDADGEVKKVAAESLKRLGFKRAQGP
jgi:HEAT repeat protein